MADKKNDKDKSVKKANADKDAIDTLPLSDIPLTSNTLKNTKLKKNARMETTVEIYSDPLSGSLQISPHALADFMTVSPLDQNIINSLAGLHSFDVYSLRSNLKRLGVEPTDIDALELSDDMKDRLADYCLGFIRPLVEKIFGQGRADLDNKDALQNILRDPNIARVRENLKVMSEKTGIPIEDIPNFFKEYSDVFLSVAYYRYSFESVGKDIDRFLSWVSEVQSHRDVSSSPKTLAQCRQVATAMRFLAGSIRERLDQFQSSFEKFWADINADSFRHLRRQVEENHASMGSVLCGLVVKISLWKKEFPDNAKGSPATRAKFVVTELEPGIMRLKDLENEACGKLGLGVISI
jgi:hypothetical protein